MIQYQILLYNIGCVHCSTNGKNVDCTIGCHGANF